MTDEGHQGLTATEIVELSKRHTVFDWAAQGPNHSPLPVARAEGVYLYDPDGQRYLGTQVMTNPPLPITEQQLSEGFEVLDGALSITDRAVTG